MEMKHTHFICLLLCSLFFIRCTAQDPKLPLEKDEITRLYEKHSGQSIEDSDDFCAEAAYSFPGVYSLGWFAHDRGCMGSEVLWDRTIASQNEQAPKVLAAYGWEDAAKREELALNWVRDVMLAWESAVSSTNEDFDRADTPAFAAPKAQASDGQVTVLLWVREPAGMLPQSDYYQLQVVFDDGGNVIKREQMGQFTVKM